MLDMMNDAPGAAASAPVDRAALAAAHAARRDAQARLAAAREAEARGGEFHAQLETVASRHRDAAAKNTAERAGQIAAAIRAGHADVPRHPAGAGRAEAAALMVAEEEAKAAASAHADLLADVQRAEQALSSAQQTVNMEIRAVLRIRAEAYQSEMEQVQSRLKLLRGRVRGFENSYGSFGQFTVAPPQYEVEGSIGETEIWSKFYQALDADPNASLDD